MKEKKTYLETYQQFREELWIEFEKLIRKGAVFNYTANFKCARGTNPKGGTLDTDGDSWFRVTELVADPNYNLHIGEDLIVGTSEITIIFGNKKKKQYTIEPDILDLDWLCEILDSQRLE